MTTVSRWATTVSHESIIMPSPAGRKAGPLDQDPETGPGWLTRKWLSAAPGSVPRKGQGDDPSESEKMSKCLGCEGKGRLPCVCCDEKWCIQCLTDRKSVAKFSKYAALLFT